MTKSNTRTNERVEKQYEKPEHKTRTQKFWEQFKSLFWALLAALLIRQFIVANYTIPTSSMEDDLLVGDFLFVNKFIYGARTPDWIGIPWTRTGFNIPYLRFPALDYPEPGDVIVFEYPKDRSMDYVKRVIAVGGQTVEIKDKKVYVDGKLVPDPPHSKHVDSRIFGREYAYMFNHFDPSLGSRDNYGPVTVPEGHFFCMGDNRDNSSDSRDWGFVPWELVVGKPLVIVFSVDKDIPWYRFWKKIRWNRFSQIIR